jgi:hypothetical protein
MASPAFAGKNAGAGAGVLNTIRNYPCGDFTYNEGGLHSVPLATCNGHGGAGRSIMQVLIRGWDIEPAYPIANVPFVLGVGIDPISAGLSFQNKAVATFPDQIRFIGYRTELRLEPVDAPGPIELNGELTLDSSAYFNNYFDLQTMDPKLIIKTEVYSASILGNKYYPGGNDTFLFGLVGFNSSYNATNPVIHKGEPAYRLGVTSRYILKAMASWDYYQEWEELEPKHKEVCRPGRNAEGLYDCILTPGGRYLNGHTETVLVRVYDWGKKVSTDNDTGYVDVYFIETDKVRWPDGTIHDHIPILVYQSQPLLQKP